MTEGRAGGQLAALTAGVQAIAAVLAIGLIAGAFVLSRTGGDAYAAARPGDPIRLVMPSLSVRAPIDAIPLSGDGVLDPPRDPETVGWWDDSARPGADQGRTVVTGHTVHTGGGSMDRLRRLSPGDTVDVVSGAGRMRYQVSQVSTLTRDEVASRARALFGQDHGEGQLVLVSCTDWDGSAYRKNIIALASPLGMVKRAAHARPGA